MKPWNKLHSGAVIRHERALGTARFSQTSNVGGSRNKRSNRSFRITAPAQPLPS
jgi:hypothetical protein